jgi:hypothetical protein|tara:strand:- start:9941 stop:10135 length:195 start_codon:yes stop_codon:yes gene_type:complete
MTQDTATACIDAAYAARDDAENIREAAVGNSSRAAADAAYVAAEVAISVAHDFDAAMTAARAAK